jgi:hypothetical protein
MLAFLFGPAAASALERPNGSLMVVSGSSSNAVFIAMDETVRKGDVADVLVLDVFDPGLPVGQGRVVESVTRRRLDCAKRTYQDHETSGYDDAGKVILSMPQEPARPIPSGSGYDYLARVACDGAEPREKMVAAGHAAALKLARELLTTHR